MIQRDREGRSQEERESAAGNHNACRKKQKQKKTGQFCHWLFEWVETGSGRCFAIAVVNGQNVCLFRWPMKCSSKLKINSSE